MQPPFLDHLPGLCKTRACTASHPSPYIKTTRTRFHCDSGPLVPGPLWSRYCLTWPNITHHDRWRKAARGVFYFTKCRLQLAMINLTSKEHCPCKSVKGCIAQSISGSFEAKLNRRLLGLAPLAAGEPGWMAMSPCWCICWSILCSCWRLPHSWLLG